MMKMMTALAVSAACVSLTPADEHAIETREQLVAQYQAIAADGQPEGENIWPAIEAIGEELDALVDEYPMGSFHRYHNPTVTSRPLGREAEHTRAMFEAAVEHDLPARIAETLDAGPLIAPVDADGHTIDVSRDAMRMLRRIAAFQLAVVRDHLKEDRPDETAPAIIDALQLAAMVSHQPGARPRSVSQLIQTQCHRQIMTMLEAGALPAQTCRDLLDAIEQHRPANAQRVLDGERLASLYAARRFFDDDGSVAEDARKAVTYFSNRLREIHGRPDIELLFALRDAEAIEQIDPESIPDMPTWNDIVRAADETVRAAQQHADTLPIDLPGTAGFDDEITIEPALFAALLTSRFDGWIDALRQDGHVALNRSGTRLMLAIALYVDERGAHPPSLDELVPAFLDDVPDDPFTGEPFGYRLVKDDGEPRYFLYSVGGNRTDNGGMPCGPYVSPWKTDGEDPECDYLLHPAEHR